MRKTIISLFIIMIIAQQAGCAKTDEIQPDGEHGDITIIESDNHALTFKDLEWPEGGASDKIPEFTKGKITSSVLLDSGIMVAVSGVEEADVADYIEEVKALGYKITDAEPSKSGEKVYFGKKGEDTVTISFTAKQGELAINTTSN